MGYNQNSGYGQALLNAVHSAVPTFGRIFIVVNSSDYAGERYQKLQEVFTALNGIVRFYTSFSDAYDATEDGNNDVIVVDGKSSHTLTTKVTMSKSRVHVVGIDWLMGVKRIEGQGSKILIAGSTAGNDAVIENTGVRNSFRGLKFESTNSSTSALWAFKDGGEFTYMENCHTVRNGIVSTATAADMLCNGDTSQYVKCSFGYTSVAITANGNRPCVDFGREQITGKVARDVIFEDCIFNRRSNDADNSFMYGAGATDIERRLLVTRPIFWADALGTTNMDECVSFGASQTNGSVLIVDPVATQTPAAISTTTGVFVEGYTPDATGAAAGIAIQAA
jgi:hypothetical protein